MIMKEKLIKDIELIIQQEQANIDAIDKYPNMYQPNAKPFYEGRRKQAEEILEKIKKPF